MRIKSFQLSNVSLSPKSFLMASISISALSGCASQMDALEGQSNTKGSQQQTIQYDVKAQQQVLVKKEAEQRQDAKRLQERKAKSSLVMESMVGHAQPSISYQMAAPAGLALSGQMSPQYLPHPDYPDVIQNDADREKYAEVTPNPIKSVLENPVSTFSIDVDTGAYSNVRRMLNQGRIPPKNAVRVEEMINYFDYQYASPESANTPFSVHTELATSPWSKEHVLMKVGLKGYDVETTERPSANLVFLLDVSGSMNAPNKLPLLKKSLLMLTKTLNEQDKVSIVVYAGASGVVLEPTEGNQKFKIEQALNALKAGGSTNGQAGIQLAYQLAEKAFIKNGINRVMLATDGDFNVGTSDVEALKTLIEKKRKKGISLTTLGFGAGNYNDHLMEQLADVGNGNYAYIDTLHEARKVLVEEITSTLMTIAKDVKIQLEFNPQWVAEYRLIGYENRMLAREDFNNDKVDAGEIGAGHTVTAIYELALKGQGGQRLEPLRYQDTASDAQQIGDKPSELGFLKLRYKAPDESKSKLLEVPIKASNEYLAFDRASEDFRFSAVVAGFGQKLRNDKYLPEFEYQDMINIAQQAKGNDPFGYRNEFVQLLRLAESLDSTQ